MASTSKSESKPVRGILKTSKTHAKTTELHQYEQSKGKEAPHFDEMNILATYHPADKDYGHMKIDEPKTPYRHDRDEAGPEAVDPEELAKRLSTAEQTATHRTRTVSTDEEDDDKFMTPKEREHKARFEAARKKHYNMKEEMRKAKELLAKEMAEDGDD